MCETTEAPSLPPWLSESFMEKALRQGLGDDELQILESEVTAATAVGDNYGSQMLRFNLTVKSGKVEKLSVVVKLLPKGILAGKVSVLRAFQNESDAFEKTLPAVHEFLRKAYPNHESLSARCYYSRGPPDAVIVLEDLRRSGFTLTDRRVGLDRDHTDVVLTSLAKIHACSLVMKKESERVLNERLFWHNEDMVKLALLKPFQALVKDFEDWPEFTRKDALLGKLKKMEESLLEKVQTLWNRNDSGLNVLLHGDSWVNNFMFKYDAKGNIVGVKFVDFQLMTWSSPAFDLHNVIFSSVRSDLKFDLLDEFLETYHKAFGETLRRLGHRLEVPFELKDLKAEFDRIALWGFLNFCCFYPMTSLPKEDVTGADEYYNSGTGFVFERIYGRPEMRAALKRGILLFEENGVF